MPYNVVISEEEKGRLLEGGGLKANTIQDRERMYKNFNEFVTDNAGGKTVEDLVTSESVEDLDKLGDCFTDYFFTMRVPDKEGKLLWPKKGYAERIKSNLKVTVKEKHQIDLTDETKFPNFNKKW